MKFFPHVSPSIDDFMAVSMWAFVGLQDILGPSLYILCLVVDVFLAVEYLENGLTGWFVLTVMFLLLPCIVFASLFIL